MKKILLFIVVTCACFGLSAQITLIPAKVLSVHDGDTYRVQITDTLFPNPVTIRIVGVDCPELIYPGVIDSVQPYAKDIGDQIRKKIKGQTVLLDINRQNPKTDKYGRLLAEVYYYNGDNSWEPLTQYILESGGGWYIEKDVPKAHRLQYKAAMKSAQKAKKGLWGKPGRKLTPATWRARY